MTEFTPEERAKLALYKEAIELVFDHGSWVSISGQPYWVIPAKIADKVDGLVGDLDANL